MGRDPRIEYKGAIYHVIQRGNNKEYVFESELGKGYFIKILKDVKIDLEFELFAFVLMDNHYHLLIRTWEEPLSKIMHRVNSKYSKYYNYKVNHIGHVFQGRYKGILVQDERYLLSLVRYIHQNPIKAHMCKFVDDYKWSSDVFYRTNMSDFVDIDTVLDIFSKNRKIANEKYRVFMDEEETEDFDKPKLIGSEAFKILNSNKSKVTNRKRLDEILIDTGVSNEDYKLIKEGSRKRSLTKYKIEYIEKAIKLKYTYKEIGENISLSARAVNKLIAKKKI